MISTGHLVVAFKSANHGMDLSMIILSGIIKVLTIERLKFINAKLSYFVF